MGIIRRMIISRYDETIKEPPYLTIPIDEMSVEEPDKDYLGEEFCKRIQNACVLKGYRFKFYTVSTSAYFEYEVVVF
jgi:hypothetical protein